MKILAIETSCDETAIALVEASGGLKAPKFKIIKNLVASQIKIHAPFGGVVPNIAKREHLRNLPILMGKIIGISNFQFPISNKIPNSKFQILDSINLVAVTVGPGLEPALWTGINFAKELLKELKGESKKFKGKLQGTSHLDGHLYSFLLNPQSVISDKEFFPSIHLIASGGHTTLLLMKDLKTVKKIGETVDDAVGEAFDKTARILGLPYPGGPEIEKLAKKGNSEAINFPRPMLNQKNYNFSFSGLKTSVLYYLRDNPIHSPLSKRGLGDFSVSKADIAASFQKAAFDVLIKKTLRAAKQYKAKSIMISGGVSANKTLAAEFKKSIKQSAIRNPQLVIPKLLVTKFPTDNAAMIATAAYVNYLRKRKYKLIANGNLDIK